MNAQPTKRLLVSSASPYEQIVGFSRVVRVGNIVAVAGTTAGSGGRSVAIGDPAAQTRADIAHWEAIGREHGEFFGDIRPANSMLKVSAFVGREWLVEIEADAVVPS